MSANEKSVSAKWRKFRECRKCSESEILSSRVCESWRGFFCWCTAHHIHTPSWPPAATEILLLPPETHWAEFPDSCNLKSLCQFLLSEFYRVLWQAGRHGYKRFCEAKALNPCCGKLHLGERSARWAIPSLSDNLPDTWWAAAARMLFAAECGNFLEKILQCFVFVWTQFRTVCFLRGGV